MTRDELIEIIFNDKSNHSCPEYSCDMPEAEGNTGDCCRRCAEKQLAEYEGKILARDIPKIPKKVVKKRGRFTSFTDFYCPCCGIIIEDFGYYSFYCNQCGQRLDWRE